MLYALSTLKEECHIAYTFKTQPKIIIGICLCRFCKIFGDMGSE
jgi:hypothetical protein